MNNLNVKEVIEGDVQICGSVAKVKEEILKVLDGLENGQYISVAGDLVAFNAAGGEIDIINVDAKSPIPNMEDRSVYNLSRVFFYNGTEANIAHDDLRDSLGIGLMPIYDGDEELVSHTVVRGYDSFAQEVISLNQNEYEETPAE